MPKDPITVTVARELADLVPAFLRNRSKELETLRAALEAGQYEQLRQLGHRMKGVGNSYGFERISVLGRIIEEAAQTKDRSALERCLAEYAEYLARVNVVYA